MLQQDNPRYEIDPNLLGKWIKGRGLKEFLSNGQMLVGSINNLYSISEDGDTLTVGAKSVYTRAIPGGNGLIGTWTDAAKNELVTYREDGFYHLTFATERVAYFGEYSIHDGQFDSKEFSAFFTTENDKIFCRSIYFEDQTISYKIEYDLLVLTKDNGKEEIFTRAIS